MKPVKLFLIKKIHVIYFSVLVAASVSTLSSRFCDCNATAEIQMSSKINKH